MSGQQVTTTTNSNSWVPPLPHALVHTISGWVCDTRMDDVQFRARMFRYLPPAMEYYADSNFQDTHSAQYDAFTLLTSLYPELASSNVNDNEYRYLVVSTLADTMSRQPHLESTALTGAQVQADIEALMQSAPDQAVEVLAALLVAHVPAQSLDSILHGVRTASELASSRRPR